MKNLYRIYTAVLVLFLWGCSAFEPETKAERLVIASWNVQNLFDGSDNGFEYDEFKNSAGWNEEKYRARLNGIIGALKSDSLNPDILALIEVENAAVIQDLAECSNLGYYWTFFASAPDSPVGMGVLSRLPLTETRVHSIHSSEGSIPRPVAEVWADTGSGPLVLMVCHWKSKLGGERKTEALRRSAAALIVRRLGEIAVKNPEIPVIILGDLNENYDEFIRIGKAYPCALLPDTGEAAALIQKVPTRSASSGFGDFLVLSGQKPPRTDHFSETTAALYSPWLEMEKSLGDRESSWQGGSHQENQGSFYYKDTWETIDHFLINAALFTQRITSGWEYGQFRVLAEPPFTNGAGLPYSYNPRTCSGLSDHLPIVLILNRERQGR